MNLPVPASASASMPAVFRASLSPLAAGGAFGGFVVALLAGTGVFGIVVLVLLGWLGGSAGGYLLGRRGTGAGRQDRIDPFAVNEPWRYFVRDAVTARNRFDEALRNTRPGPLKDRLVHIRGSVESGVRECWEVAKQAQTISDARKVIDVPSLRRRLESLESRDADTTATERAVRSQLESAARLDAVLGDVTKRLEVLEAKLTEAVTRAIEVSALAGHDDELTGVGTAVDQVVIDLESLRAALDESSQSSARGSGSWELPPSDG
ncbi:MAG: hypothetical protein U5K29_00230 [Acidimicrobiales bacterium]|nr:hypothetical protein [Acidimicrobiales bacterium]